MSELRKKLAEAAQDNLDDLLEKVASAAGDIFGRADVLETISAPDVFKMLSSKRTASIRAKVIASIVRHSEAKLIQRWEEAQEKLHLVEAPTNLTATEVRERLKAK